MDLSATAVDEIDDIVVMVQTMARLGVSHKGLKTLDEMKSAVKQKLTILPKKIQLDCKRGEDDKQCEVNSSKCHGSGNKP